MSTGRVLATIAAAILIFFGVLFVWGAFSEQGNPGWILVGLIGIAAGFILIWLFRRRAAAAAEAAQLVQKIELSGDIDLETLTCEHCGGRLSAENIQVIAGSPVVSCPYCNSSYQISEEPKW